MAKSNADVIIENSEATAADIERMIEQHGKDSDRQQADYDASMARLDDQSEGESESLWASFKRHFLVAIVFAGLAAGLSTYHPKQVAVNWNCAQECPDQVAVNWGGKGS